MNRLVWGRGTLIGLWAYAALLAACGSSPEPEPEGVRCAADQKRCGGACVQVNIPSFGCAAPSCDDCALPMTVASCNPAGECAFSECLAGAFDCDAVAENGCEVAESVDNCGGCGIACPAAGAHAMRTYCGGRIGFMTPPGNICRLECEQGYQDADEDVSNGCEKPRLVTEEPDCPEQLPVVDSECTQPYWGSTCHYSHPELECVQTMDCKVPLSLTQVPFWAVLGEPCPG